MKKTIFSFAVASLLAVSQNAQATARQLPSGRITDAYAKRLVAQKATELGGRHGRGWKVTFGKETLPGQIQVVEAEVSWGREPHIALMTPSYLGFIFIAKGKGAPKGLNRVFFTNGDLPGPVPLNAVAQ